MAPILWSAVRFLWVVVGMAGAYAAFSPAFRTLAVESLQSPSLQGSLITGAVAAFFLGAPWLLADQWLHQQERNARAQKTYASLTRDAVRLDAPLVFYLRSFDWDEKFGNEKVHKNLFGPWILWVFLNPLILVFFVWRRLYQRLGGRLESLLYRAASQSWGPMIDVSLGRPQGRGFGRVRTTDAEWRQTAGALLDRADLVLMMFSDTTGTSWELEQLVARGRLSRTVFLIPPAYALRIDRDTRKYQLERDYRVFCERMRSLGYATPRYEQAMAFRVDANPDRVAFVCFDKDFDSGGTKQLRKWLRAQGAEISTDEFKAKRASARWRGAATGLVRLAAAAVVGWPLAANLEQQTAMQEARDDARAAVLQTECAGGHRSIDDETIIAACSTIIANTGGVQYADIDVINNRGIAHLRRGDHALAIADFTRLIERNGADAVAFYNRALTRQEQGDLDGAFDDFGQVIVLGADSPVFRELGADSVLANSHSIRGSILAGRGERDAALREYDAAIEVDPQFVLAYVLRASVNWDFENHAAVIADTSRALELEPDNREALVFRALAYIAGSNDRAAASDLDRAIALDPGDANALFFRGQARIRLGRAAEGQADLEAANALESSTDPAP